jgi:DNA invertase Pin-like site-specific DNA recombinase
MAMSTLHLTGIGAIYLRVSGDRQELQRQQDSIAVFEKRHGVQVPERHRYADHGYARDLSAKRPDFQRMLRAAQAGDIQWIVVDQIDRFGFADEWELVGMVRDLRAAGCKLYDTKDDEWTSRDLMSFFKVGLAGHSSHNEQVQKSYRALGGMVTGAKNGEFQGGPPKLGFDIGCFDKATGHELWRVIYEGRDVIGTKKERQKDGKEKEVPLYRIRRIKLYPDGREERFDGDIHFRTSDDSQVIRLVPTKDPAKLAAAKAVFQRYANESISLAGLAKWLNSLKIRTSFGGEFQCSYIVKMLGDETYLGYPTFGRCRGGRFHSISGGSVVEIDPALKGRTISNTPEDVIRPSTRLFEPLVDRETWDRVQKKLRGRGNASATGRAPKNPHLYLAGLVFCAGCGAKMVASADRMEYYCGTYDRHRVHGTVDESPCERNGVRHALLEEYLSCNLTEVKQRLDLLLQGCADEALTDKLRGEQEHAWLDFTAGLDRIVRYLAEHCPADYAALLEEDGRRAAEEADIARNGSGIPLPKGTLAKYLLDHGFDPKKPLPELTTEQMMPDIMAAFLDLYRARFDPAAVEAEIQRLDAEHTRWMETWANPPSPGTKAKAEKKFRELEAQIGELRQQRQDAAEVVVSHYRAMLDLQQAVADALRELRGSGGHPAPHPRLCTLAAGRLDLPTGGRGSANRSPQRSSAGHRSCGGIFLRLSIGTPGPVEHPGAKKIRPGGRPVPPPRVDSLSAPRSGR